MTEYEPAPSPSGPASFRSLDPEYFRGVEALLREAVDRRQINANTLARFGRLWVRNLLRNVPALVASPGVSALAGAFDQTNRFVRKALGG